MKTVTLRIEKLDQALDRFADAWKTGSGADRDVIAFEDWEVMHRVLSPNRMAILRALGGAGTISIRELARRAGRDFKGVHSDVRALLDAGILRRNEAGVEFPFDRIRLDVEIPAAA